VNLALLLIRALTAVSLFLPQPAVAVCLDTGPAECRYPAGDTWCAEQRKPAHAFKDACLKTHRESNIEQGAGRPVQHATPSCQNNQVVQAVSVYERDVFGRCHRECIHALDLDGRMVSTGG
jgi:hypothetical protein